MAITYAGTLATDLDKVRFHIGDTDKTTSIGPKPNDGQFTDDELNGLITLEGSWGRAVAAAFEALAALWAKHPNFSADGMSASQSDIAEQYRDSAATWRLRHGSADTAAGGSGLVVPTRMDGYSDDVDSATLDEDYYE
jgi:hypothetical protein